MNKPSIPTRFSHLHRVILSLLVLAVAVSVTEPAFSVTFTASLTTTCATLTPSVTSVLPGSSGTIRFACGTRAALTVNHAAQAEPLFTLPAGYSSLTVVPHDSIGTSCNPGSKLISDSIFHFTKTGSFDYCAPYSNPPTNGLDPFTLTWSKGCNIESDAEGSQPDCSPGH